MKRLEHNWGYLIPFFLFVIISALLLLKIEQGDALRFFSDNRTEFWNQYFIYGTQLAEEFIYGILTLLAFVFISIRLAVMIPITGLTVMLISFTLKSFFRHKRPIWYFTERGWIDDINLIEGVEVFNGDASFPSGHTMAGFALFYLLAIWNKNITLGMLCFYIALTVGISRIYLFEHFLKDILFGACLGVLIVYLIQYCFSYLPKEKNHWLNKNAIQLFLKPKNRT